LRKESISNCGFRISEEEHFGFRISDFGKEKGKRENPSTALRMTKEELIDKAYESFCRNLEMLRRNFDIKTICMHGSPRSKFDNRLIWTKYDYRDLGIIGEPYFDIDFSEVLYLTDTGRRWDGVSVRDKAISDFGSRIADGGLGMSDGGKKAFRIADFGCRKTDCGKSEGWKGGREEGWSQELKAKSQTPKGTLNEKLGLRFRSTWDIIRAAEEGRLPDKMMITVHPQRWNDSPLPWVKELILQNIKNVAKWGVLRFRMSDVELRI